MARPIGAENKYKPFRAALNRQIDAAGPNPQALDKIARALLQLAESGDVQAIREVADRLDGKVAQALVGDKSEDAIQLAVEKIERVIVRPPDTDC
jgi:hypothetical protein